MERRYSLSEIDRMRKAIRDYLIVNRGTHGPGEATTKVEEELRTHLMAGTDIEELEERAREWIDVSGRRQSLF